MRSIIRRLRDFYFSPGDSFGLGVNRFLVCLFILFVYFFYRGNDASFWAEMPDAFWFPIHVFRRFPILRVPASVLEVLDTVWFVALICTALGLFTRFSSIIAWVCGTYLISLPQNFGKIDSSDAPILFVLLIFAASRCGDGFSLDSVLRRFRNKPLLREPVDPAYGWPNKAAQILFVAVFFAAGVSKLRNGGLAWMTSENMANKLMLVHYFGLPTFEIGLWLARLPLVCWAMAVATIVCETGCPVALFSSKVRAIIIPMLFFMLIGFRLTLGHWPIYLFSLFVFWVPWGRLRTGVFISNSPLKDA